MLFPGDCECESLSMCVCPVLLIRETFHLLCPLLPTHEMCVYEYQWEGGNLLSWDVLHSFFLYKKHSSIILPHSLKTHTHAEAVDGYSFLNGFRVIQLIVQQTPNTGLLCSISLCFSPLYLSLLFLVFPFYGIFLSGKCFRLGHRFEFDHLMGSFSLTHTHACTISVGFDSLQFV